MGFGGHLMLTPLARELKARHPDRPVVFATKPRFWHRLLGQSGPRPVESEVFRHNPHLTAPDRLAKGDDPVVVYLDSPAATYWTGATREQIFYKKDGHAIDHICAGFGIENPERKCELYLSEGERTKARILAGDIGPFIAIEPHTNDEFTVNKDWGFERWQTVVDELAKTWTVVQLGEGKKPVLAGVEDLTGRMSFRETAALIGEAELFTGPEGGLMHAANAVGTPGVIVYGGYISPDLTGYAENTNLFTSVHCAPCGLRTPCPYSLECMTAIAPGRVIAAIRNKMGTIEDAGEP